MKINNFISIQEHDRSYFCTQSIRIALPQTIVEFGRRHLISALLQIDGYDNVHIHEVGCVSNYHHCNRHESSDLPVIIASDIVY